MATIAINKNTRSTWLAGLVGLRAKAREMARRAMAYAASTVLICAVGAALAQLVAQILTFPVPIAVTAMTLLAAALLTTLGRHLRTQARRR